MSRLHKTQNIKLTEGTISHILHLSECCDVYSFSYMFRIILYYEKWISNFIPLRLRINIDVTEVFIFDS
jgi:hypothetical protein